jgi:diguanylate cyclase (GGDEF)-like protein
MAVPAFSDAVFEGADAQLERLMLALRGADEGVFDWDLLADVVRLCGRAAELLGLEAGAGRVAAGAWRGVVHPEDVAGFRLGLRAHLAGKAQRFVSEHRVRRVGEERFRWVLARGLAVVDGDGRARRLVGTVCDVSERRARLERLEHDALHDALTGLPNRVLFLDRLAQALRRWRRRGFSPGCAVLFCDLDGFKAVNDSLGHSAGDRLLQGVARRLERAVRPGDTVARLGGDEFVVLLEEIAETAEAVRVAGRMQETLAVPLAVEGREVVVSASIGVALAREGVVPEALVREADRAMYRAKAGGKATPVVVDGWAGAAA